MNIKWLIRGKQRVLFRNWWETKLTSYLRDQSWIVVRKGSENKLEVNIGGYFPGTFWGHVRSCWLFGGNHFPLWLSCDIEVANEDLRFREKDFRCYTNTGGYLKTLFFADYFRRDLEIAGLNQALDDLTTHENLNVKKRALIILTRIKAQKIAAEQE